MPASTKLRRISNVNLKGPEELVTITNPDVEVTLPEFPYGYRTSEATWDELVQIIEVEYDIPKLSRSRDQQHHYEVFRHHMKQQYDSSRDFILISKFGFDAVPSNTKEDGSEIPNDQTTNNGIPSEQKLKAHPCLEDVDTPKIVLVQNDFPYYMEDNVVHYVLWKIKEPITEEEIKEAREELQSEKIKALGIIQWRNPPYLQSIPAIDHVHFLCRIK